MVARSRGRRHATNRLTPPLDNAADKVHLEYLRHLAGVGKSTPSRMLLREYDRHPVMWHWLTLAVTAVLAQSCEATLN